MLNKEEIEPSKLTNEQLQEELTALKTRKNSLKGLEKIRLTELETENKRRILNNIDDNKKDGVFVSEEAKSSVSLCKLDVAKIRVNPFQPRKQFSEDDLKELADSIQKTNNDLIQPIVVALIDGVYYLIAGERRLRAHKLLGLTQISTILHIDLTELDFKIWSILENLQRVDLNCIELGQSFKSLNDEGISVREIENKMSKKHKKSYIANRIKIANLAKPVIEYATENKLFEVSKLLEVTKLEQESEQLQLVKAIVENKLSLDEIVKLIQSKSKSTSTKAKPKTKVVKAYPYNLKRIEGIEIGKSRNKINIQINEKLFKKENKAELKKHLEKILEELK